MRRRFYPWTQWECFKAGFYATTCDLDSDAARGAYATFFRDINKFELALERVLREWPTSCDQFLSNEGINRIAWLGQASMCIATGIPSVYRGGFKRLTVQEQRIANATAARYLTKWLREYATKDSAVHSDLESARLFG